MTPNSQPTDSEMLRLLLDDSPDLIYFKDLQSRFIRGSRALCEHLNISPEELVGKSDYDFFAPERVKPHFEEEQEIIRTGRALIGRMEENIGRDGKPWWVLTSKAAFRDQVGRIIGTFGISKNITELKQAEAALEQSRRHLLELSKKAGMAEIAADILHNAGNVLNSAGISAEILRDQITKSKAGNLAKVVSLVNEHAPDLGEFLSNDPKGKPILEYLRGLSECLVLEQDALLKETEALIRHLKTIGQIVASQRKYEQQSGPVETFDLGALVGEILESMRAALDEHRVTVVRNFDSDVPALKAERDKVARIVANLLRNAETACLHSGASQGQIVIDLNASEDGSWLNLVIADNGCGLEPRDILLIFSANCATRKSGFGMGLHRDWLFARSMGGKLTARSDGPGKGAVFLLELPTNCSG